VKYIIGAVVATAFWILILNFIPAPDERVLIYDCGMSEWHPDIPAEVKEECRKRYRGRVPGVSI
jgi:hypothetical protein